MSAPPTIGLAEVERANAAIGNTVRRTPVELSPDLTALLGVPVWLKLEHHQVTGSFKLRGAANAVLRLNEGQRRRGVVGVSTGNHGRALAHAARDAGAPCIICMSKLVPQNKIEGIETLGAEARIVGTSQDEAQVEVDRLVTEEGMTMVPPFDHPDIIAGQGTVGLELIGQVAEVTTVLVPVSGGGLIAGVSAALKPSRPGVRVIGVSMERGAAMYECLKAGRPKQVEELATLADSLGGGIGIDNQHTFRMVRDLVDDMVLVSEAEIAHAIRHLYWHERQIVEGSGSVGVAALLSRKVSPAGPCAVLLTGGNIDMKLHHRIISGEDVDVTERH